MSRRLEMRKSPARRRNRSGHAWPSGYSEFGWARSRLGARRYDGVHELALLVGAVQALLVDGGAAVALAALLVVLLAGGAEDRLRERGRLLRPLLEAALRVLAVVGVRPHERHREQGEQDGEQGHGNAEHGAWAAHGPSGSFHTTDASRTVSRAG